MKKNAYWVLSRDKETTELRFSKCFYDQSAAEEYLPWYRDRADEEIWKTPAIVTLETLPVGEMPKMRLPSSRPTKSKGKSGKTTSATKHFVRKRPVHRKIVANVSKRTPSVLRKKPPTKATLKPGPRKRGPSKG